MSGDRRCVTLSGHVIEAYWPTLRLFGLALLLGRIVLSFLPPGEPGGHSLRKLPLTLVASLLVGLGLMLLLRLSFDPFWASGVGLCAAGGLVRFLGYPGGIVPRHEPIRERVGWLARVLLLGALVPALACWSAVPDDPEWTGFSHALDTGYGLALAALLLGIEHGLATARRAPLGRRVFVLVLALFLFREQQAFATTTSLSVRAIATYLGCGAAFALGWLRRADRRSAILAIACFCAGRSWGTFDGVILSAAALLALTLCTAPASRAWIAKASVVCLALSVAPATPGMIWAGPEGWSVPLADFARLAFVLAALASGAWIARSIAARARPEVGEWRAALASGDRFLLLLLVLGAAVCWTLPQAAGGYAGLSGLYALAPVAFLLAGCVSIRPERVP